jgi:tetratricopeptide (TPR) repeat protein
LKQLLDAGLSDRLAQDVSDHVNACLHCQTVLERLSDDTALVPWKTCREAPASEPSTGPGLARVLAQARFSTAPEDTAAETRRSDDGLPFLEPPRRPGDLGTLGPYAIEAELGRGGMGIVLRGYDARLERHVALKVLRPDLTHENARARFVREAQAAARVRHDHVVSVYAVDSPPGGPPYLVMELLDGATLAEVIRQRQCLEPGEAARLGLQIADGLHAAHQAGLVHRDVKPANLLLDTATGRAKLTDFGLARLTELPSGVTQEGVIVGTPAYMSPEQARGAAPDPRSDVYSLGATLYELLTGTPPFRGAAHLVLREVLEVEPRSPRRLNDAVPRDLETVCLKAMAKEPGRRYATAGELADDLRRWLRGEPVRARPVGPAERLWRWCRRRPLVAGLAAVALGLFAAGLAGVLWQWRRAEANAAEASAARDRAEASLQDADVSFRQARAAVDRFFNRVYSEPEFSRPGMRSIRRQALQDALGYYQGFLRQRGDDPSVRAELAEGYYRVGYITAEIADKAEALEAFRHAVELYQGLADAYPDNRDFQHHAALGRHEAGLMLVALSRSAEALRLYEQCRDSWEALSRAEPANRTFRGNLVACYGNLAHAQGDLHRLDDAARSYQQSSRLLEQLRREEPANGSWRIQLGRTYNNLGLMSGDQLTLALDYYRRAVELREQLAREDPKDSYRQHAVGRSTYLMSLAESRLGQARQALATLEKARGLLEQVTRTEPAIAQFQMDLGCCYLTLADRHREAGRPVDAIRSLETARAIYDRLVRLSPRETSYRRNLAAAGMGLGEVHAVMGKPAEALAALRQVVPLLEGLVRDRPDEAGFAGDLARARTNRDRLERSLAGQGRSPGPARN